MVAILCRVGVLIRLRMIAVETNVAQTPLLERIAMDHSYLGKQNSPRNFGESGRSRTTKGSLDGPAGYVGKDLPPLAVPAGAGAPVIAAVHGGAEHAA